MSTPLASLSSSLGSRLLAGVGTLALLAAVGLFSSRPARTAGGPVPVTVANAPLAVTAADNPAKQPFQAALPSVRPRLSPEQAEQCDRTDHPGPRRQAPRHPDGLRVAQRNSRPR